MRQRKDFDPKFKLPLFYGYPEGSERVFCECLGERALHEVTATIRGRPAGYWPAIRPGQFVELNWKGDPQLLAAVTYNGRRADILSYESLRQVGETFPKADTSPTAEIMRPWADFAAHQAQRIEKFLPADMDAWKRQKWGFRLEIRYSVDGGSMTGQLSGTLLMTMEHLWLRFKDDKGHETPVQWRLVPRVWAGWCSPAFASTGEHWPQYSFQCWPSTVGSFRATF
jgi:hypothetical protein